MKQFFINLFEKILELLKRKHCKICGKRMSYGYFGKNIAYFCSFCGNGQEDFSESLRKWLEE